MPTLLSDLLVFVAGAGLCWVVAARGLGRKARADPIPPPQGDLIHLDLVGRILYVNDPIRSVLG